MDTHIIITAGGFGKRFGSVIPKQFLEICGKPILVHTMEVFHRTIPNAGITLVLPEMVMHIWDDICARHKLEIPHKVVRGGTTRFNSVKNGLDSIVEETLIGIHDGVRPLVSSETIIRCFEAADAHGAAIPVMPVHESLRIIDNKEASRPVDRNLYRLVQTPQCFKYDVIKSAYDTDYQESFTDDATIVEAAGYKIKLVEGNIENIKITTPSELQLAKALIDNGTQ